MASFEHELATRFRRAPDRHPFDGDESLSPRQPAPSPLRLHHRDHQARPRRTMVSLGMATTRGSTTPTTSTRRRCGAAPSKSSPWPTTRTHSRSSTALRSRRRKPAGSGLADECVVLGNAPPHSVHQRSRPDRARLDRSVVRTSIPTRNSTAQTTPGSGQAKLAGSYLFPWDVLVAANYEFRSGEPWARQVQFRGGTTIPTQVLRVEQIGASQPAEPNPGQHAHSEEPAVWQGDETRPPREYLQPAQREHRDAGDQALGPFVQCADA